jgi:hypothetical protein
MQHACLPAKQNNVDSSVAVDSVLDFEGEGFKWVFASNNFLANKADGKIMSQSLCTLSWTNEHCL